MVRATNEEMAHAAEERSLVAGKRVHEVQEPRMTRWESLEHARFDRVGLVAMAETSVEDSASDVRLG